MQGEFRAYTAGTKDARNGLKLLGKQASPAIGRHQAATSNRLLQVASILRILRTGFLERQTLPAAEAIQQFLHRHHRPPVELGVSLQPFLHFLFRTEEIVDSSTAPEKSSRAGRIKFLDSPVLEHQMDALAAILGGIFDGNFLVAPFRVDQRDEVVGSIGVERLKPFDPQAVIHEVNAPEPLPVNIAVVRHPVAHCARGRLSPNDSEALKHAQPG